MSLKTLKNYELLRQLRIELIRADASLCEVKDRFEQIGDSALEEKMQQLMDKLNEVVDLVLDQGEQMRLEQEYQDKKRQ